MVFTESPADSCNWWGDLLGATVRTASGFFWLDLPGDVELGFHPADEAKNPLGGSTVPYWRVDDLEAALTAVLKAGGRRHRGPLDLEDGRRIAQVVDPFGAVVGFDQS